MVYGVWRNIRSALNLAHLISHHTARVNSKQTANIKYLDTMTECLLLGY